MTFDIHKLLQIAGQIATEAGQFGVPYVGLAGAIGTELDKLISNLADAKGVTREQVIADVQVAGAANLIELAKDAANQE